MTKTVTDQNGTVHHFPDEATPEMISQALGLATNQPVKGQSYFQRIGQDIQNRAQQAGKVEQVSSDNNLSFPHKVLGLMGPATGMLSDVVGETAKSGLGYLFPQISDLASKGGSALLNSFGNLPAFGGGTLASTIPDEVSMLEKNHPVLSQDVKGAAGLAGMFTPINGNSVATIGSRVAKDLGENTANVALSGLVPSLDSATKEVGQLAIKHKIPLSLNELSSNRVAKTVQKVSQELPFSGETGFRDKQLSAFNKAILNTVGENADKFTPKVMDNAFKRVGGKFDNFANGKNFTLDDNFARKLDAIREDARSTSTNDAINNYTAMAEKILGNADKQGNISGEKLATLRSQVNAAGRKSAVPGTPELMNDLENAIIDHITDSSPEAGAALTEAKHQYKNLLAIEPLAQKSIKGNISPQLLAPQVARIYGRQYVRGKAGDIGEIARVGRELLPAMEGSDTAQKTALINAVKSAAKGTAATGAAAVNLPATAAILGGNRLYQSGLNRNSALVNFALKTRGK